MMLFCVEILTLAIDPGAPVDSLGMALSETWTFPQFLPSYSRGKDRFSLQLFLCALSARNAHRISVLFSIIFSASNLTLSDVDFLKSQNKASAWPVCTRVAPFLTQNRCSIESPTSISCISSGGAIRFWKTFARDARCSHRLQFLNSGICIDGIRLVAA
jgi:hypothetical protein